jgi:hypothetical protein
MKTTSFTPSFFLARKDMLLKITTKTIIGRSAGDIVLEDDTLLSSSHCEINPRLLEIFIKDLNSTNGTFVNNQKIFPESEVRLNVGDSVKIGSFEYILYDNADEAKKVLPPRERRKNPRPENLYSPINLVNFFSASRPFQILYVSILVATIASVGLNMHVGSPLPQNLEFLGKYYTDNIVLSGAKLAFLVWFLSIAHAYLMVLWFNRNPLRMISALVLYLVAVFYIVDFKYGPLGGIKLYAQERHSLETMKPNDKAIIQLKVLTDHKKNLGDGFVKMKKVIHSELHDLIKEDHKKQMAKIDVEINKLDKILNKNLNK